MVLSEDAEWHVTMDIIKDTIGMENYVYLFILIKKIVDLEVI